MGEDYVKMGIPSKGGYRQQALSRISSLLHEITPPGIPQQQVSPVPGPTQRGKPFGLINRLGSEDLLESLGQGVGEVGKVGGVGISH